MYAAANIPPNRIGSAFYLRAERRVAHASLCGFAERSMSLCSTHRALGMDGADGRGRVAPSGSLSITVASSSAPCVSAVGSGPSASRFASRLCSRIRGERRNAVAHQRRANAPLGDLEEALFFLRLKLGRRPFGLAPLLLILPRRCEGDLTSDVRHARSRGPRKPVARAPRALGPRATLLGTVSMRGEMLVTRARKEKARARDEQKPAASAPV